MSTPPTNYDGIIRVDTKQTDLTVGQYNGQARPGELIIDLTTYDAWIGMLDGSVVPFNNPLLFTANRISNGTSNVRVTPINGNIAVSINGTANTAVLSDTDFTFAGDLLPPVTETYSIGNSTLWVKDVWISGSTAYVGNIPISEITGNIAVNGTPLVTTSPTGNLDMVDITTGNITGSSLVVTGNTSVGGALAVTGYISTAGDFTSTDTITGGNLSTGGTITALGDIVSGGNVNVTGNVNTANVVATGNVGGTNLIANTGVVTDLITSLAGPVTLSSLAVDNDIVLDPSGIANVDASGAYIVNLNTPINPQDLATKAYADTFSVGLETKDAARCTTTASLATVTGDTVTYNNGTAGVGATLNMASALTTIDGVVLVAGDRIIVKNEPTQAHNGIYVYTDPNTLTRATDADTPIELAAGTFIFCVSGAVNGQKGFTIVQEPAVIGTNPIVFVQISSAASLSATNGISLAGSVFSVSTSAVTPGTYTATANVVRPTVTSKGIITAVTTNTAIGPLANLQVVGNLTVSNISTTTNFQVVGNATATNSVTSGSIYTAGSLNVGGNLTIAANLVVSGNANLDVRSNSSTANVFSLNNIVQDRGNVNVRSRLDVMALGGLNSNLGNAVTTNGLVTIGPVNNFRVMSNASTSGNYLVTDGGGTLSWSLPRVSGGNVDIETLTMNTKPFIVGFTQFTGPPVVQSPISYQTGMIGGSGSAVPPGSKFALANPGGTPSGLALTTTTGGSVAIPSGYVFSKLKRTEFQVRDRPILFEVEMYTAAFENYGALYMGWDNLMLGQSDNDHTPTVGWSKTVQGGQPDVRSNQNITGTSIIAPTIQLSTNVANTGTVQLSLFTMIPWDSPAAAERGTIPYPNWQLVPPVNLVVNNPFYDTKIPRTVLTSGKRIRISWLYYYPTGSSRTFMWLYLNDKFFYATNAVFNEQPWLTSGTSTNSLTEYAHPRAGVSAMKADSSNNQTNILQGLTKFYLGNGEEFMYRHGLNGTWLNSLINMPA